MVDKTITRIDELVEAQRYCKLTNLASGVTWPNPSGNVQYKYNVLYHNTVHSMFYTYVLYVLSLHKLIQSSPKGIFSFSKANCVPWTTRW